MRTAQMLRRRWPWFGSVAAALVLAAYGVHRFAAHATPLSALDARHEPVTGVVESLPFEQGRLIVSEIPQGNGFNGWYLTRNFWGWHEVSFGAVSGGLGRTNYPIDWAAVNAKRKTLLWGVVERPMNAVVFTEDGRLFSASVGTAGLWHMTVPGAVHVVYDNQWLMRLRNGKLEPMYPHR